MIIVKHRNTFFAITGAIVLSSIISLIVFGLHLGIDFTGGTLVQVTYPTGRPAAEEVSRSLTEAGFTGYSLREAGTNDYILRAQNMTEDQRANLIDILSVDSNSAEISQLNEIGPTIGKELRNKALIALAMVLLCILLFIAFASRKVSQPVSSWRYGLIALLTLCFDVIVPVGFFAFLEYAVGIQVDALFVTAVLTILGYSVHDTIVVFDRTRENLRINHDRNRKEPFEEVAGRSLNQTFVRSINTSLTTALVLTVLFVVGPESTKYFALTLLVGIITGTYSSIFLATPLLVTVEQWRRQKGK